MISDKLVKDKLKYEFNAITGKFDLVSEFNPDRIITHSFNMAGSPLITYDARSGTYIDMGPLVVTDNQGNVVTAG